MEHRNQDSLNKDNRMIAIKVTQLHERCPELTFLSSVKIGQGLGGGGGIDSVKDHFIMVE